MSSLQLLILFGWSLLQSTVVSMPETLIPAPAPELQGPSSSATVSACGGCYLVADVVGLVWYSEILKPVIGTEVVSVAIGNGTNRATSTVFKSAEAEFTYTPGATVTGGGSAFINFDSTYEIAGHTLTSPTAYNVYSAYSITSSYISDGECVTTKGPPIKLTQGFTQILSTASGEVFLNAQGEQSFINSLGFTSCSGGGANIVPLSLIQAKPSIMTTTLSFSSVSLAAATRTLPPTTAPKKTSSRSSTTVSTLVVTGNGTTSSSTIVSVVTPKPVYPSVSAPVLVFNSTTFTLNSTPFPFPIPIETTSINGSPSVFIPSVAYVIPTGTGAGNYTTAVVPYISQGIRSWQGLGAWVAGVVGLVTVIFLF